MIVEWFKSLFRSAESKAPQPVVEEKVEQVVTEKVEEITVEEIDFNGMTKMELDIYARKELGIHLDRRRRKDYMIEQIKTHLKEK